jgi:hypothetical protein
MPRTSTSWSCEFASSGCTPGSALLHAIDDPDQLQEGIEDNLRSLRVSQLASVNLPLPGDGRGGARFDDQLQRWWRPATRT